MKPLIRAIRLIKDRGETYGTPSQNHRCTAAIWSAWLSRRLGVGVSLTPEDVCWLNSLQKHSRAANGSHDDNIDDVCGFMGNIGLLEDGDRNPLPDGTAYRDRPGGEREQQAAPSRVRLLDDQGRVLATVFV